MTIRLDPEGQEPLALFDMFDDFGGKSVLEVGCGDGRLTWRYAARAAQVAAIDPDARKVEKAIAARPRGLEHVRFVCATIDSFAASTTEKFDIAILAWSL